MMLMFVYTIIGNTYLLFCIIIVYIPYIQNCMYNHNMYMFTQNCVVHFKSSYVYSLLMHTTQNQHTHMQAGSSVSCSSCATIPASLKHLLPCWFCPGRESPLSPQHWPLPAHCYWSHHSSGAVNTTEKGQVLQPSVEWCSSYNYGNLFFGAGCNGFHVLSNDCACLEISSCKQCML